MAQHTAMSSRLKKLAGVCSGGTRSAIGVLWTAAATSGALVAQQFSSDKQLFCRATQGWGRVLARAWGMRVRTLGADDVPQSEPCIFVGNHQSYADIVAVFSALPVYPHFIAKRELGRVPFLGQALRAGQHILLDRSGGKSAMRSLKQAAKKVAEGRSVVIFPEGTRGGGDRLLPFQAGGFHLARMAGVAVVPFALCGTERVLPRGGWTVRRAPVEVRFAAPIPAAEVKTMATRELMARAEQAVTELLFSGTVQRSSPTLSSAAPLTLENAAPSTLESATQPTLASAAPPGSLTHPSATQPGGL